MDDFIEYDSFVIAEKPQKVYKGFYKDGKPYNGYFSKGKDEFPRVDYYENGEARFQYSLDVYQMALGAESSEIDGFQEEEGKAMNEEDYKEYVKNKYKPKLNIKSVYKNGKIVDGYEYGEISSGIFSKKIVNQKFTELHIDVFAMHYYQRTSVIKRGDDVIISSPTLALAGEKLEVRLVKESEGWKAFYYINEEEIGAKYFLKGNTDNLPANSTIFIYDQNNKTYGYGTSGFKENSARLDFIDIQKMYFEQPEIFSEKSMQSFFEKFIEVFINEMQKEDEQRPEDPEVFRGYILIGNSGKIIKGIRFFEKGANMHYIEYKDGSEVKNAKVDIDSFQKVFKEYMNRKYEN
ncbi:hypothetical protein [uncultured Aquimarina sp.]|uniref:hypothetical protein n=1 Tax=uncultured Aquimarina sp. TaxID=575652 RepID=UPI0026181CBE|nr:hypothetical protein [uncultured Aquimarina sp.]